LVGSARPFVEVGVLLEVDVPQVEVKVSQSENRSEGKWHQLYECEK
jgi:hypothetical protein